MAIRVVLSRKLGELRWTQADLSRRTGIRAATINHLYHNFAKRVSLDELDQICDALGCGLYDIVEWEPNDPLERDASQGEEEKKTKTKR